MRSQTSVLLSIPDDGKCMLDRYELSFVRAALTTRRDPYVVHYWPLYTPPPPFSVPSVRVTVRATSATVTSA